ncbi:MAG TPA: universal stress protein [Prosthecobacter sp.]
MKAYTTLIAAVDFTPSCRNALREAARLAAANQASLTAVHVMDEFLVHELKRALSTDQASVREEWTSKLKKFVEDSELGLPGIAVEIRIGNPFAELSEASRVHKADLLVMGAKGSRNEPGRVGVIAAKCVRKAPLDVLLIREDAVGPFKHLVTCVDFSDNSKDAVRIALDLARKDGASLDCMHVYQSALAMSLDYGGLVAPMPLGTDTQALEIWQKELDELIGELSKDYPEVKTRSQVLERVNIREAILDHVKETHADLVVLGTRGKTGLRELLIGTTAEKIVSNAPCSILAVKPEGFAVTP